MATFRKRNGKWQVQVRRVGTSTLSRTFLSKADANAWAIRVERELQTNDPQLAKLDRTKTLSELLSKYDELVLPNKRNPESEGYVLKLLGRHPIAFKRLSSITVEDFARLRDERLEGVKPSTLKRQFGLLRHALTIARREWRWFVPLEQLSAVSTPKVEEFSVLRVTDERFQSVLAAATEQSNPWIGIALQIALHTGLRKSELFRLKWTHIDLNKRLLTVETSKSGHSRVVPISSALVSVLEPLRGYSEPVLPISSNCFRLGFERARTKVKASWRIHDLRHEAISRWFEAGLSVPEVMLLSGHRTMSQLSRYTHPQMQVISKKLGIAS